MLLMAYSLRRIVHYELDCFKIYEKSGKAASQKYVFFLWYGQESGSAKTSRYGFSTLSGCNHSDSHWSCFLPGHLCLCATLCTAYCKGICNLCYCGDEWSSAVCSDTRSYSCYQV